MQRKITTLKTSYVRDTNATAFPFRHARNRQEVYANKGNVVKLVTTHTRHAPDVNGNRYTIRQVATASRAETLAEWANGSKGEFSVDGLTFTTTTEI